ncbi:MFS transporter [Carnobacterium gallinarum]|uniref:MFS transporter n=1 Tax=Carnobacterium gallinarum TaxID=2749 RepID=UPI00068BF52D|nr:MFS transporter [Carnobacterium gallinarum]
MEHQKKLLKNIQLNYYFSFFISFGITSMWVLYLAYKGMSLWEIGLIEGIFHGSSLLFEIPSGAIADTYGLRKTLIVGRLFAILSGLLLIFASSFWLLSLGFVLSALSYNLNSGTNEALVFESLKANSIEKTYLTVASKMNMVYEISSTFGIIVAGVLLDSYFEGVYLVQIALAILSIVSVFRMIEPPTPKNSEKKERIRYRDTLKEAYNILKGNLELVYLMAFFAILEGVAATFFFYFQSYLDDLKMPGYFISLLVFISCLFQATGSKCAPQIEGKLGKKGILFWMPITLALLLLAAGLASFPLILIFYVAINTLVAILAPIASDYFNQLIPSEQRATLISVSSMFYSFVMIILFPLIGGLAEIIRLKMCFILMGIFLSGLVVFQFFFTRQKQR